jgi:hypothetical protein
MRMVLLFLERDLRLDGDALLGDGVDGGGIAAMAGSRRGCDRLQNVTAGKDVEVGQSKPKMRLTVEASAWPWTRKARRNSVRDVNNESSTYRVSGARELLDGDEHLARLFLLLLGHVGLRRVALESAMGTGG